MKTVFNEQTKTNNAQFSAILRSIGTTVLQNSNKKNYKLVTIDFTDVNSVERKGITASIYEGNYSKGELTVGNSYLCTAAPYEGPNGEERIGIQMSHLSSGDFASPDMFDFADTTVLASAAKK